MSLCVSVCVSVSTITKKRSRNFKFEYIVAYEDISDEFDSGHCLIKVKDGMTLKFFSIYHNTNCQVLYISALAHGRKFELNICVHLMLIYKVYEYHHA